MKLSLIKSPPKSEQNFPVIGIGASAGGLDAFKKLLRAIPKDSGMAYVIIQHLSPDHPSNLTDILSQVTEIPVFEIINDINMAANNVYIIPENNLVVAQGGVLKLQPRNRIAPKNSSIDIFFESLAEVHKSFAVGVILSGTAFDGTMGFKKIKEFGGVTIAQDPDTAAFKGMPQNAINADVADYILPPELIPARLLQIHQTYAINHGYTEEEKLPSTEEEILNQILTLMLSKTSNDFRNYKRPTIRRRIARRMVAIHKETLSDYYNYLRNDKNEQESLFNDFLISVTYFFRDQKFFEKLTSDVFPRLIQNMSNNTLRIWVAGCATGEEAYSLAILLDEYLAQTNNKEIKVQIFASDISQKCITKARTAMYSSQDVQLINPERLRTYFIKRDGQYQITKTIRDMCIFAVHNFIKDPPFARIDMVSCRNVLIYFDQYLQTSVLGSFHYSLKEKGVLFLGKSESAANTQELFAPLEKHEKIYLRKIAVSRHVPEAFSATNLMFRDKIDVSEKISIPESDFRKITSDILFARYTPSCVIIDEHLDIVHFHGDTGTFLLPSEGKPNFNILKMAREGLGFELQNAISKVKKDGEPIIKENIIINEQDNLTSIEVTRLPKDANHLLVVFSKKPLADPGNKYNPENTDAARVISLEAELKQLREDIKRVTEEQQTAFEELQTTNEELLSSSEELQALNEELETSTEELQSNNEELMCVNDELLDRQDQLISMRNYSESIIQTIREPLLIIDKDFVVKSANPAFYKYFQTTEIETETFSFFEIGDCQWDIPEFKDQIKKMLSENHIIEDFMVESVCKGIGKKIMMVNARTIANANPPGMILLALEDITDLAHTNDLLVARNAKLQEYNEQLEAFSTAASHDLQEPLRKIHMFCKRTIENEQDISESGKHNLERMLFAVTNMSQMITDLINYSMVNFLEKDFKKTDINIVLKKVTADLKESITEKNAVIKIDSFPQLDTLPTQMQQLFINLITNSLNYSKEDKIPEIKIESKQPSTEELAQIGANPSINYLKICVKDNGIGFHQLYENRIFDPFYRLHNNDQYNGSGLGLTLSKKIVANHKGFIKAASKIDQGTTIFIYLPLQHL